MLGPVFRTYEPARDRLVAVKAFRLDLTPEQARTLADELQALAGKGLDHPSIVRPIAAGIEGSLAWMASEYVASESLDIALRHYAPAPLDRALPFITQLAGALDFARTAGIGHGALHPRDIFVTPDEARATGFGIVQALEKLGVRPPVRRPYTAPERVDDGEWDGRADVYSLAAIAFELMTGRRPVGEDVGTLGDTAGPHAGEIGAVLSRALADDPSRRYPSALAFAAALEASARGERTTAAIDEVQAVAQAPGPAAAAPAIVEEGEPAFVPDDDEVLADDLRDEDVAAEREADLADIQLREEEAIESAARAAEVTRPLDEAPAAAPGAVETPRGPEPSLFELDLEREGEEIVPELPHAGFEAAPGRYATIDVPPRHADQEADRFAAPEPDFDTGSALESPPALEPEPRAGRSAPAADSGSRRVPEPARDAGRAPRPRSILLPVTLMLLLGLFVGFVAGYLVGGQDRGTAPGESTTVDDAARLDEESAGAAGAQPAAPPAARPTDASPAARPPVIERAPESRSAPPAPARGRLVVRSTPPGAQVFVNGRRRGTTPLSLRNLPPGTYSVRVSRSGYEDDTRRVAVAGGAAREIAVRLTRERPRAAAGSGGAFTGSIYVDSRPRGARVLLDGRAIGTTPLQVGNIRAGAHVVRLELPDHRTWTASTRVVAGETVRVTGSLERVR